MTSLQKEVLFTKWNSSDRETRIRLACKYLKLLRAGEEKMSWLIFLENNMDEK